MSRKNSILAPLIKLASFSQKGTGHKKNSYSPILFFCFFVIFGFSTYAQETTVSVSIDSTHIKIGEQLLYGISVETDSTNLVVFPEEKTFAPMEVVEALDTDTSRVENRFKLLKKYTLTKFDSGSYTIPQQKILVKDSAYLTDSVKVEVTTVVVDTTKQKMYPIKPTMEVPKGFHIPNWAWWIMGILILAGIGFYFFRRKKKKDAEANKLPPYEQALFELKQLDESHLLENRQTKEYYSKLTEAVRRYLEDEVHLRAMESTTSELITYLELKMQAGELKLGRETIDELKVILQRADLAKFANSKPDIITAKEDRSKTEHVITNTKDAIPEPTEEELLRDEEYRQAQAKKRKRRKITLVASSAVVAILIAIVVLVSFKGTAFFTDLVFGNSTKELLDGDWISSDYGDPAVSVTTPEVLTRENIKLSPKMEHLQAATEAFSYGELSGNLRVVLSTMKFQKGVKFDIKNAVDGIYSNLESKGAKNIVTKNEDYSTIKGVKGVKVYGTMDLETPKTGKTKKKEYRILNFAENGGFQQITIIYDSNDKYADKIASRIINSVEFENASS